MSFIHLHVHSEYSLLDGASKIDKILEKVKFLNQKAVAITDHGTMSGLAEFHTKCKKAKIKPILGLETYVAPDCQDFESLRKTAEANKKLSKAAKGKGKSKKKTDEETPASIFSMDTVESLLSYETTTNPQYYGNSYPNRKAKKGCGPYVYGDAHLVLLAKNLEGYRNLCKISTEASMRGFYFVPRSDFATLKKYGKGIIALSACLGGEIPRLILRDEMDMAVEKALAYQSIFDAFFLEIQPGEDPDQIRMNEGILEISARTGIPTVVTTDAHYINQEDAPYHRNLIKINSNGGMSYAFKEDIYYLWSEAELRMAGFPEDSIQNTVKVADMIEEYEIGADHFLLPHFAIPQGFTDDTFLAYLAQEHMFREIERYPEKNNPTYWSRLEYELAVMKKKDMSGYMLIVWDFINWARNHDIYIGPGRGSSAGSLVAYLLRIVTLDPIEQDLMFERFTNPDRPGMPDIDTDFEEYLQCPDGLEDRPLFRSGRDLTTRYVKERYGEDCICKIITHGELGTKLVLKDIARVLSLQDPEHPIMPDEVTKVNKFIPSDAGEQWSLQDCLEGNPEKGRNPVSEILEFRRKNPTLFENALRLEGLKRTSSTHAAAVVITPEPVDGLIPLKRDPKDGSMVSQYDMEYVEKLCLTKMDFLGLKNLGILHHAHDSILERHGVDIFLDEIPLSDPKAMALIRAGKCAALFQVESEGMRKMFREMEDVQFPDLVAGIALYRPGPMQFIPSYVSRRNGYTEPEYLFPELKNLLEKTYGILVYQEQAMYIARDLAGFNNVQMDGFRKGIGKKNKEVIAQQIDWLVNGNEKENIPGLVKNGIPRDKAEKLGQDLVDFGSYCFNKCVSGDTEILRPDGSTVTVAELFFYSCPYGQGLSMDEDDYTLHPNDIVAIRKAGVQPTLVIEMDDGSTMCVSHQHKFPTVNLGKVKAKDLRLGHLLFRDEGFETPCVSRIKSINPGQEQMTYDVTMAAPRHNFVIGQTRVVTCNSHAAAYAKIVSQTAYMKAHYPVEYMAAVLTCNTGTDEDPIAYIRECQSMGIEILPPDINLSRYEFMPESDKSIRFGLGAVRNLAKAAYLLAEERDLNGPYVSIEEWHDRCRSFCNDKVRSSLILSGAFDTMYPDLTRRDILYRGVSKEEMHTLELLKKFLVEEELLSLKTREGKQILDTDPVLLALAEKRMLGFYLMSHPLRGKAEPTQWENLGNREKINVVFQLLDFRAVTTKKGKAMCFLKIDTLEGEREIVMWEDVMDKAFSKLHKGVLYKARIEFSRWNGRESYAIMDLKYYKEDTQDVPDLRDPILWAVQDVDRETQEQGYPLPV